VTDDDEVGLHLARLIHDRTGGPAPDQDRLDGEVGSGRPDLSLGRHQDLAMESKHLIVRLAGVGRAGHRSGHAGQLCAGRGDTDDTDTATLPEWHGCDEVPGLVSGAGTIDGEQDTHQNGLLRVRSMRPRSGPGIESNGP
jgi:hypothetical protein